MSRNNNRSNRRTHHTPPDDGGEQSEAAQPDLADALAMISAQLAQLQLQLQTGSTRAAQQERASSYSQDDDETVSDTFENVSVDHSPDRPPSSPNPNCFPSQVVAGVAAVQGGTETERVVAVKNRVAVVVSLRRSSEDVANGDVSALSPSTSHTVRAAHTSNSAAHTSVPCTTHASTQATPPPTYISAPTSVFVPADISSQAQGATSSAPHCNSGTASCFSPNGGRRWYVVTRGLDVGVYYETWDVVAPLVIGVTGAIWWRAGSRTEANTTYARALAAGRVHIIGP